MALICFPADAYPFHSTPEGGKSLKHLIHMSVQGIDVRAACGPGLFAEHVEADGELMASPTIDRDIAQLAGIGIGGHPPFVIDAHYGC